MFNRINQSIWFRALLIIFLLGVMGVDISIITDGILPLSLGILAIAVCGVALIINSIILWAQIRKRKLAGRGK